MPLAVERRALRRAPVSSEVLVVAEGCVEGDTATVVNVSPDGARVEMSAPARVGQRVRVLFRGQDGAWCTAQGRVVGSDEGAASLAFHSVEPAAMQVIRALMPAAATSAASEPPRPTSWSSPPAAKGAAAALMAHLIRGRR